MGKYMDITIDDIKQYILENLEIDAKRESSGRLKASFKLQLPGIITIKGFVLKESNYEHKKLGDNVWIEPPSVKTSGGQYFKLVFFEDDKLWEIIEQKIYEAYQSLPDNDDN